MRGYLGKTPETATDLEFLQINRQFGALVSEGEGDVPVEHTLPVSRVRWCFGEINLRIVQGAAQQCLALLPFVIAYRRLLDPTDGQVARNLN